MRRLLLPLLLLALLPAPARAETAVWTMSFPHQTSATERVRATPDGAAWAVIDHSRIMRSTDAGRTWLPVNPVPVSGLPTDGLPLTGPSYGGASDFAIAAASAGTALVANADAVSRTDDGGLTWHPVRVPALSANGFWGFEEAQRTGGRWWLAATGADIVRSCAVVWRTTPLLSSSDGRTWHRSDLRVPDGQVLAMDFGDARHGAVSVIDYTWTPTDDSGGCGFTGTSSSSVVFVTDDGGRTWRRAIRCPRACWGVAYASGGRLLLGQWDGTVLQSRDGGHSFRTAARLPVVPGVLGLQSMDCSRSRCWALVNGTGVYRQDGSGEWVHEVSDADAPGICTTEIAAIDDQRVVAAGPHGLMARVPLPGGASPTRTTAAVPAGPAPRRTWRAVVPR